MAMDFSRICRICLDSNKQTFDIFTSYYVKRNTLYSEMISNCTKIKPYQGDELPRLICKECCRQLKRTYTFNLQCEESDKKLKCYIGREDALTNGTKEEKHMKSEGEDSIKDKNIDEQKLLISGLHVEAENKEGIKLEPSFMYDDHGSCWDGKDDNSMLEEIKSNKHSKEPSLTNEEDESCWDAEDDNLLLDEIKSNKQSKVRVKENKPKKKRGRKKRGQLQIPVTNSCKLVTTHNIKQLSPTGSENDKSASEPVTALPSSPVVLLEGELPPLPESKLPHQCDICGKFLSTKSNLKAHKICHTNLRPYKCTECPASFRGHSALFQHKKVHTGETPYHCEYCPKQFSRRTGLVNHIRMHTGEKQYCCDICFKTFVQSAQLSIHMRRHKGDKPFLCQDCGKGFPIKADLKVHQRIHNGEKPYSCHLCAKTFATSGNLSIHIRIHNKEIRYRCKECARGFVTCSAYNVHLKRHKGQRDYHCECGKTFYTSSALKQHRVVHTGEKKYQCKICDRKFTQTSHLSRHFKRDHAKPNAPVPSSDHYKLVLQDSASKVFGLGDTEKLNPGVKCEGS